MRSLKRLETLDNPKLPAAEALDILRQGGDTAPAQILQLARREKELDQLYSNQVIKKFTKGDIAFVTDNSRLKPGCVLPGTDFPIVEEGEMLSLHPDYAVMTAWNFEKEILGKMDKWRARGGKFIIPDREIRIV